MPWHPGAGAGCSEQRPGGTVALGYIHTYILGGRYRDAVQSCFYEVAITAGGRGGVVPGEDNNPTLHIEPVASLLYCLRARWLSIKSPKPGRLWAFLCAL